MRVVWRHTRKSKQTMQNPFPQLVRHVRTLEARIEHLQHQVQENARVLEQHAMTTMMPTTMNTTTQEPQQLRFLPFSSRPEASFFRELAERKLAKYMLAETRVDVVGWYQPSVAADPTSTASRAWLEVRDSSFTDEDTNMGGSGGGFSGQVPARGVLINVNTIDKFKALDKASFLREICDELQKEMIEGLRDESSLSMFAVVTYADLKTHKYLYWFAFASVPFTGPVLANPVTSPQFDTIPHIVRAFWDARGATSAGSGGFCCVFTDHSDQSLMVTPLRDYKAMLGKQKTLVCLACLDPSGTANPGWPVRNLLAYARLAMDLAVGSNVTIVCLRQPNKPAIVWDVIVPAIASNNGNNRGTNEGGGGGMWEPSETNKMSPRLVDLSATLDPSKLSETASDLNVRLMKWRALPELNESILKSTRVLLLGAGTLGCGVARSLLGWGFRHITFCDQGKVSYSNPSRQSLFVVADCVGGGKSKAERAAAALHDIHPGVHCNGVTMSIPMPGHFHGGNATEQASVIEAYNQLNNLVQSHDVICLLTDTRESRWLPSLLGAAHDKIVLNAALGFDSFLVMRHGGGGTVEYLRNPARLGCYFCSDVVAPINSMKDRTLDQQCTVTRPGGAPVAAALLVELLVGVLHHPKGNKAPLSGNGGSHDDVGRITKLGILPHQIRGFLPTYENTCVNGPAFPQCTACSEIVVETLRKKGVEFVLEALQDPTMLEKLTGLDRLVEELKKKGEDIGDLEGFEDDDDEEEE